MDKKSKKKSNKKWKHSSKGKKFKKRLKYKNLRERIRNSINPIYFKLWFNDDPDKIEDYIDFLLEQQSAISELDNCSILEDRSLNLYQKKINSLRATKSDNITDLSLKILEENYYHEKIRRNEKLREKDRDLSIASYLNSKKYKKKFLNGDKYRKELKNIAKAEKQELKEMRQLGYIKTKDVDKELNKLLEANKKMSHALSDAYTQKHFID